MVEGLTSLLDKSLLRQEEQAEGEARFWMLQTLREFGLEHLNSEKEAEATRVDACAVLSATFGRSRSLFAGI